MSEFVVFFHSVQIEMFSCDGKHLNTVLLLGNVKSK